MAREAKSQRGIQYELLSADLQGCPGSRYNPFAHWIVSGIHEGRKINKVPASVSGQSKFHSPSLIFIAHEASRTGADADGTPDDHALDQEEHDDQFLDHHRRARTAGPDFEALAPCFYMEDYHHHFIKNELRGSAAIMSRRST